jgi:hypothetical protein
MGPSQDFRRRQTVGTCIRIGYNGKKRYLKLLADFSGTHGTGTPMSAVAILANPKTKPVA